MLVHAVQYGHGHPVNVGTLCARHVGVAVWLRVGWGVAAPGAAGHALRAGTHGQIGVSFVSCGSLACGGRPLFVKASCAVLSTLGGSGKGLESESESGSNQVVLSWGRGL